MEAGKGLKKKKKAIFWMNEMNAFYSGYEYGVL